MIDVAPIIERLAGAGAMRVSGVLEYASHEKPPLMPAHYVMPDAEDASAPRTIGVHDQRVAMSFQCW